MIKTIKKIFNIDGLENISTPTHIYVRFKLMYEDKIIGYLTLSEGEWSFEYSTEFKLNNFISPLLDFPDTSRVYRSKNLWPFFAYRIPGLNQPKVRAILEKDKIDEHNEVELLKKFGNFSIYNPFKLLHV